jgi:hypothetical protein
MASSPSGLLRFTPLADSDKSILSVRSTERNGVFLFWIVDFGFYLDKMQAGLKKKIQETVHG